MAYTIYNNNGTILVNLASGEVDDITTSLDLVGKNVNNYGEILNNNLVRLLTNFSSTTAPRSPQVGQLWFNPTDGVLRIWKGDAFKSVYDSAAVSSAPVNPNNGDYWFDTTNSQLKVWTNGNGWNVIGPNLPTQWGRFGVEPPYTTSTIQVASITDNGNNNRATAGDGSFSSVLYNWGRPAAILSRASFQLSSNTYNYYTTSSNNQISTSSDTLVEGVNVLRNLKVFNNGYIEGNLYLKGDLLLSPNKNLSSQFNIRNFGNPLDVGVTTATRVLYLNTSNIAIRDNLKLLFPTETTSTFNTYGYPLGSEVRVLCEYTTAFNLTTSVSYSSVAGNGGDIVTVTTSTNFGNELVVGQLISVQNGSSLPANGVFSVFSRPTAQSFTYKTTGSNVVNGAITGAQIYIPYQLPITEYSVRRFRIKDIAGVKAWDPEDVYFNVLLGTWTNIVVNPNPPLLINTKWAFATNVSNTVTSISTAATLISFTTSATLIWDYTDGAVIKIILERPGTAATSTDFISTTSYITFFNTSTIGRYTATVVSYALTGATTSETRIMSVYNTPIVSSSTWAGLTASTNTVVSFSYDATYASQVEVIIKNSAGQTVTSSSIFYNAFSSSVSSGVVTATFTLTGVSTATLRAINPVAVVSSTIKTITIVP